MANDIVERLRVIHCAADDLTPCGTCLPCQAADEIERLRAEIERLRAIAEFAAHSDGCEQPWHGIKRVCTCGLMELWEARCG